MASASSATQKRTSSSFNSLRSKWTEERDRRFSNEESGREELTTKVTAEHEIEDEEAVLIVLECVTKIDDEGVVDLPRTSH